MQEFPSGAKEIQQLGLRKAIVDFRGQYVAADAQGPLETLIGAGPGKPILFVDPVRPGVLGTTDPSHTYLMRRTSAGLLTYEVPEVVEAQLTLEEVL